MRPVKRLLSCGCRKEFPAAPAVGDIVHCGTHYGVTVIHPVYILVCDDCLRFDPWFPDTPVTAMTKAAAHCARNQHTVRVYRYGELVHTAAANPMQLTIDDVPPF